MPTIEERLVSLETKVEMIGDLRTLIVDLRDEMIRRFEQVDRRFEQVDRRFEAIDRRFELVDQRFAQVNHRIDWHLTWLIGLQITLILGVLGGVAAIYFK